MFNGILSNADGIAHLVSGDLIVWESFPVFFRDDSAFWTAFCQAEQGSDAHRSTNDFACPITEESIFFREFLFHIQCKLLPFQFCFR